MPDHIGEKCRCCSSASLLFLWTKIANLLETAAWKRAFPDAHARVTHAKALKVSPSFAQLSAPLNFAARYRLPASTAAKSTKAMQAAPAFGYCGRTGQRNSPWARQTGTYYYGTWLEPNLEDKTRSQSDRANEQWRKRFSFPQKKKKASHSSWLHGDVKHPLAVSVPTRTNPFNCWRLQLSGRSTETGTNITHSTVTMVPSDLMSERVARST